MTNVVQIQKKKNLFTGTAIFVRSVINVLGLLSEFRETKTRRGRASKKCHKKAVSFPDFWIGSLASEDSGTHYWRRPLEETLRGGPTGRWRVLDKRPPPGGQRSLRASTHAKHLPEIGVPEPEGDVGDVEPLWRSFTVAALRGGLGVEVRRQRLLCLLQ